MCFLGPRKDACMWEGWEAWCVEGGLRLLHTGWYHQVSEAELALILRVSTLPSSTATSIVFCFTHNKHVIIWFNYLVLTKLRRGRFYDSSSCEKENTPKRQAGKQSVDRGTDMSTNWKNPQASLVYRCNSRYFQLWIEVLVCHHWRNLRTCENMNITDVHWQTVFTKKVPISRQASCWDPSWRDEPDQFSSRIRLRPCAHPAPSDAWACRLLPRPPAAVPWPVRHPRHPGKHTHN